MSIVGPSYQIARPTRRCAATGRELATGERFVATLVEVPGHEDLARLDFSEGAWRDGARPSPPMMLFGSWRGVVGDDERAPKQLLDDDELLDLFDQLGETDEPRRIAFRFVLALALVRRRLLSYEGGTPAAPKKGVTGTMLVKRRGSPEAEVVTVIDPGMDEEAVDAAIEQIGQIMNMDAAPARKGS